MVEVARAEVGRAAAVAEVVGWLVERAAVVASSARSMRCTSS